jgi:limonene-1,2-epoxide hydrolase
MQPRELILKWVDAFNRADADAPVQGRAAIRKMFADGFAAAKMHCLVENLFVDGDWVILEWKDRLGLRGCGFFQVADDRIQFQREYWDKLTFLRTQGLPLPESHS